MSNLLVDILKRSSHKEECANQVFERLLRDAEDKVKRRLDEGGTSIPYDFPMVKPGLPTYDLESCVAYVTRRLNKCGLDIERTGPRSVKISWDRLLQEAKRQRSAVAIKAHREKKAARDKKRESRKKQQQEAAAAQEDKSPGLPPHAEDPNDIFCLPSVRNLKSLADELRHV